MYSVICIIFLLVLICKYSKYTNESKTLIESSIKQFESNSQIQLSNYYEFLKETVTNESFENKEFIKNTLEEAFKPNIDLLRETLKDSKDFSINTVTFWLAFLSLIMIIFTILGIYANNKIMESNQKQSELIIKETELESNKTLEELSKKAQEIELTLKKIKEQTKQSKINADRAKVSELLSRALNEQINKNYDEAIKLYTEALEIDSNNIMSLNNRGLLYYDKYKETKNEEYFTKALCDYDKVLNINENDINALNNRGNLYSNKYRETKDEDYFNKALDDFSKLLIINSKDIYTLNNISILYLNHYEITNNKESLKQAEIYINKGLEIEQNNMALLNNKGILLYLQYKENKESNDAKYLKESLEYLNRSIEKNTLKKDIGETYYYLSLVYDEYAKLDENISGYSKEECENKSKEYLQNSKKLGYKHFMEK
ncbi:tetratricopeptide repeat protein [Brachyspira intermedia]|uniref:tetratricopeptide repeat protein n=1 Tax=Brachyspira intermedia TaxID=84377 RepID=UPI0030076B97